ncbi:MAG: type II secretion system F family protein [Candidatus Lindowbacteria bacterium]|nr:type II secretion system F family protein [Candidatus Lindowbacteria bacterium]
MPSQFEYSGVDSSGQPTRGIVEGESPIAVVLQLRNAGARVYSIKKKPSPESKAFKSSKEIGASDLAAFNEQLSSLLRTRLPFTESLSHLRKEMKNPRLKEASANIIAQLEAGKSLSESLALQREYFPPLYISMVEAGEKSGNLTEVLYQAAAHFRSVEDFRKKFVGALIYPAMLTLLSVVVLISLIKLMVPPYVEMYSGFHVDFPLSLRLLVSVEALLGLNRFWTPILVVILAATVMFAARTRRDESFRRSFDEFILRIPVWGEMAKEAILAQSVSTLAILLRSGAPLHESLSLVRNMVSNRSMTTAFDSVCAEVAEGNPFSQALVKQPVFPLEIAWLIRNGETNGDLPGALDEARRMCQSKFELSSRFILSVLEPALLVIFGVLIVLIVVSLFYPLYALTKFLGG